MFQWLSQESLYLDSNLNALRSYYSYFTNKLLLLLEIHQQLDPSRKQIVLWNANCDFKKTFSFLTVREFLTFSLMLTKFPMYFIKHFCKFSFCLNFPMWGKLHFLFALCSKDILPHCHIFFPSMTFSVENNSSWEPCLFFLVFYCQH